MRRGRLNPVYRTYQIHAYRTRPLDKESWRLRFFYLFSEYLCWRQKYQQALRYANEHDDASFLIGPTTPLQSPTIFVYYYYYCSCYIFYIYYLCFLCTLRISLCFSYFFVLSIFAANVYTIIIFHYFFPAMVFDKRETIVLL